MEREASSAWSLDPLSTLPLHIGMRRQDLEEVYGSRLRRLGGLPHEVVYSIDREPSGSDVRAERLVLTLQGGKLTAWYRVKGARAAGDE